MRRVARVLILTASIGEGHDLPARLLADGLQAEAPGSDVVIEDGLPAMGRPFVLINERAPGVVFHHARWVWDAAFWLFVGWSPSRSLTKLAVGKLGASGLLRLVAQTRPDVVVSTYPITTEVLAALRRRGNLQVPVVAAITDLAMMQYWAAPGMDLHLVTHPESVDEVRSVAGQHARVEAVRGLIRPEFETPRSRDDARSALRLPLTAPVVAVSGGGWGVGDIIGAIDGALAVNQAIVVCLCGRNDALRARVAARYAQVSRVRTIGFTDAMSDWLAAADVLIHSTGGLTVLEAAIRGCPTISYGWGRGHIRANNAAFTRYGLAEVVSDPSHLGDAIAKTLAAGRRTPYSTAELPTAASLVLSLTS
jgi:UDP-N-acetylglucosamine:LPS N-acetylglucosamine transferase